MKYAYSTLSWRFSDESPYCFGFMITPPDIMFRLWKNSFVYWIGTKRVENIDTCSSVKYFITRVCLVTWGRGVVPYLLEGTWDHTGSDIIPPPESQTRVVRILLECFLVIWCANTKCIPFNSDEKLYFQWVIRLTVPQLKLLKQKLFIS